MHRTLRCFFKHSNNSRLYWKCVVLLDTCFQLQTIFIQVHFCIWAISTQQKLIFTVVCQDKLRRCNSSFVYPLMGSLKLHNACIPSSGVLNLYVYYESMNTCEIKKSLDALLIFPKFQISKYNFNSNFFGGPSRTHSFERYPYVALVFNVSFSDKDPC